ncbi:hypothetical protein HY086_04535 [Candidatus Gottesmanbacteria bacterium]|nr:hypothetical protein [Candidatus Gottesmanbacteria bacterium]
MNPLTGYTATVSFVKNLAGDYYHGRFELKEPSSIDFIAGQYVVFQIGPPKLRHTLSITSPPQEPNRIEVLQSIAPHGEGSKWLTSLKEGDSVQFLGPVGKFTLQKTTPKQKVFVATGCGIAPLRSMLADYLGFSGGVPVVLYWGLRFESDLFWQEELAALAAAHSNFHYFVTLSKPTDGWRGMKGRVTDHVVDHVPGLLESEFYLCGNREMIVEVRKQLMDAGVAGEQIFTETFF